MNNLRKRIWKHRFNVTKLHWWKPLINRQRLDSGAYEGFHLWFGPIHVWNVITQDKKKEKGFGWR